MSTLTDLWKWLLGDAPRPAAPRRVVIVAGGAHGVGTSLVTALLGSAAAAVGRSVLLVEGGAPGLADLLGAGADSTPEPELTTTNDDFPLIYLAPRMTLVPATALTSAGGARAARLRRTVARTARYDLALIDAGARVATVRELCTALGDMTRHGDRILAITTPAPASTASAYALAKSVLTRSSRARIDLLVNRADPALAASVAVQVQEGAQRFLRRSVGFAGSIPDDAGLRAAIAAGIPFPDAQCDSSTITSTHEALGRLLHEQGTGRSASISAPHQAHQLQEA